MNKIRELDELNLIFKKKNSFEVVQVAMNEIFKNKSAYVCSFGTESSVLLHMISTINNNFPIIFINTSKLFKETLIYKDKLKKEFNLKNLIEVFPSDLVIQKYDKDSELWKKNPDLCCNIRKVLPLKDALKNFDAWFSGRKSFHSQTRKKKNIVELENNKYVISPLLNWSQNEINGYFIKNNLQKHPLFCKGYLSIGCEPCTSKSENNEIRSGRWKGNCKTECGIHKN